MSGRLPPKLSDSIFLSLKTSTTMATSSPPPPPRAASRTPCAYFAQGKCRNGSACGFYHAPREDLAKHPTPCRFFLQNACTAGELCRVPEGNSGFDQRAANS